MSRRSSKRVPPVRRADPWTRSHRQIRSYPRTARNQDHDAARDRAPVKFPGDASEAARGASPAAIRLREFQTGTTRLRASARAVSNQAASERRWAARSRYAPANTFLLRMAGILAGHGMLVGAAERGPNDGRLAIRAGLTGASPANRAAARRRNRRSARFPAHRAAPARAAGTRHARTRCSRGTCSSRYAS